jgi:Tfp pilus assembly protein PilN
MSATFAEKTQINLFNPSLVKSEEVFTANRILVGVVGAVVTMAVIGWWAASERQRLTQAVQTQAAARTAELARLQQAAGIGDAVLTPQELAAREQMLKSQVATLDARRAVRDGLRRGLANDKQGPSALLKALAGSVPADTWITELRAEGSQFELTGRTLDAAAVNAWQDRLHLAGTLAATPLPVIKVERADAVPAANSRAPVVYSFTITATLAAPLAGEKGRQ